MIRAAQTGKRPLGFKGRHPILFHRNFNEIYRSLEARDRAIAGRGSAAAVRQVEARTVRR
jgi:hypothetical protein